MKPKGGLVALLVFGLMFFISVSAQALPIGTLNITGEVRIDATHFDWLPGGGGDGVFLNGFSSTGTFAGLEGTTGLAKDLDLTITPVGIPFLLNSYLVLAALPNVTFDLNFIYPGDDFGALSLTDTASGVNLAWGVQATATDAQGPVCYTGTYSSQVNGLSSTEVLALLSSPSGLITTTYSASFSPCPVPLPATAPLVLTGLAGLFWQLARRRHQ
jgi:hypothetical protein